KKTAAAADMMNTIRVVIMVSRRVGHVTLLVSDRTSCRNLNGLTFAISISALPCLRTRARRTARNVGPVRHFAVIYTREFRKSPSPGLKAISSLAGVEGLEPPTPGFGDRCSSH